ncbi:Sodium/hydrogen exchanger family-domain-containing protein [Tribonema minus]|uniref:Sodium/hydrogen exchanger family-domain-containing protein n=1 Tax=Tribonema minus TaxID=303371 RepID=A0A835Z3U5_9STRA|nr:Sodium/hydrogen exchanger family-domain-containing protein [Tribonema minus]
MLQTLLRRLSEGGGVIAGDGPLSTSLTLYLMQIIVIMTCCQLLGMVLVRFNQPRVIAEVIGGILLGPSFLGRIPGFTDTLFPPDSINALELTASLGLIFFLFIVGLELDPRLLKDNAKRSLMISVGGQGLTWVFGVLLALLLYNTMKGDSASFATFVLFMGVAMSLTAFPVLSRILTEGRLLGTTVGITTIGSAAFDDLVAWSMLALVLSIVHAGQPQQALYVFLTMVAFVIVMLTAGRKAAAYLVRRFGANDNVSLGVVFCIFVTVLLNGWFTQIIGVDAIFGAFVTGLAMPKDGKLAITITEKLESFVTVLLLPIFFAKSGLKTDFGALSNGKDWGYAALVILGACTGKIVGCGTAAKLSGLGKRESLCVGVLMNTRGLVELIILNAGLAADIINDKGFAIMVLMAVVTTCMTSPLTAKVYPPHLRHYIGMEKEKRLPEDEEGADLDEVYPPLTKLVIRALACASKEDFAQQILKEVRLLVCLPGRDVRALASSMTAVHLLRRPGAGLHAVRVVELGETFSADMAAVNAHRMLEEDSMMAAFTSYCGGQGEARVSPHMVIGQPHDLHTDTLSLAQRLHVNTLLVGLDPALHMTWPRTDEPAPPSQQLVEQFLAKATDFSVSVAVVVDRGAVSKMQPAILVPIGSFSACENEALLLAMAMAANTNTQVVVMLIGMDDKGSPMKHKSTRSIVEDAITPLRGAAAANGKGPAATMGNPGRPAHPGSNRSLPWFGSAARGHEPGQLLAGLGQYTWHGRRSQTGRRNSDGSDVRMVDAVRAALQEQEERQHQEAGRALLDHAVTLGVEVIQLARRQTLQCLVMDILSEKSSKELRLVKSEASSGAQMDALLDQMRPPRSRSPIRGGGSFQAAAATRYPLVVCGRRMSVGVGSDPGSILGRFGTGIAEAFPGTSLVVVQSGAAAGTGLSKVPDKSTANTALAATPTSNGNGPATAPAAVAAATATPPNGRMADLREALNSPVPPLSPSRIV